MSGMELGKELAIEMNDDLFVSIRKAETQNPQWFRKERKEITCGHCRS